MNSRKRCKRASTFIHTCTRPRSIPGSQAPDISAEGKCILMKMGPRTASIAAPTQCGVSFAMLPYLLFLSLWFSSRRLSFSRAIAKMRVHIIILMLTHSDYSDDYYAGDTWPIGTPRNGQWICLINLNVLTLICKKNKTGGVQCGGVVEGWWGFKVFRDFEDAKNWFSKMYHNSSRFQRCQKLVFQDVLRFQDVL